MCACSVALRFCPSLLLESLAGHPSGFWTSLILTCLMLSAHFSTFIACQSPDTELVSFRVCCSRLVSCCQPIFLHSWSASLPDSKLISFRVIHDLSYAVNPSFHALGQPAPRFRVCYSRLVSCFQPTILHSWPASFLDTELVSFRVCYSRLV